MLKTARVFRKRVVLVQKSSLFYKKSRFCTTASSLYNKVVFLHKGLFLQKRIDFFYKRVVLVQKRNRFSTTRGRFSIVILGGPRGEHVGFIEPILSLKDKTKQKRQRNQERISCPPPNQKEAKNHCKIKKKTKKNKVGFEKPSKNHWTIKKTKKTKSETDGLANFAKRVFRDFHFRHTICLRFGFFFVFLDFTMVFLMIFANLLCFFCFFGILQWFFNDFAVTRMSLCVSGWARPDAT